MKISDIDQITAFLKEVDFDDAVVKEVYFVSPTYFTSKSIVFPNAPGHLRLVLITNDDKVPALEFEFEEVTQVYFSSHVDINPKVWKKGAVTYFSLTNSDYEKVICENIGLKVLDESFRSTKTRFKPIEPETGNPTDDNENA